MDKKALRETMRERRRALAAGERAAASSALARRIGAHPWFVAARRVGLYYPNDGEIDATGVAGTDGGRQYFLPVLPPPGQRRLWFAPFTPGSRLVIDRYGIPEPTSRARLRAEDLDLVLVPLVAFDDRGGRIGMGGGFYDASLAFLRRPGRCRPTRVLGVAYRFQQVDAIAADDWDVPLDGVVTDSGYTATPAGRRSLDSRPLFDTFHCP